MKRRLSATLVAALAGLAGSASAATLQVTPDNLAAQLGAAKGGDTLEFAGEFGQVLVKGRSFSRPVTLDLRQAKLANLMIQNSGGVMVVGGAFTPKDWTGGVYVANSKHVVVSGVVITDDGKHTGLVARGASDVEFLGARIVGAQVAVQILDSDRVKLEGSAMAGSLADAVTIASSTFVTVSNNLCWAYASDGHHPDCVQVWTVPNDPKQSSDIVITGNLGFGASQGAGQLGGDHVRGVVRMTVSDNTFILSYPLGIALGGVTTGVACGNRVRTLPIPPGFPRPAGYSRASVNITAAGVAHGGNKAEAGAGKPAWDDGASCPAK